MQQYFDYKEVPADFMHCMHSQCNRANECLRRKVMQYITKDPLHIPVLNSFRIPQNTEECPHFYPDSTTKFALGITHLFDKIPHPVALSIKNELLSHFSKSTYYRIRSKERLIDPDEQKYIRQLFLDKGIEEEPIYDKYIEKYKWY